MYIVLFHKYKCTNARLFYDIILLQRTLACKTFDRLSVIYGGGNAYWIAQGLETVLDLTNDKDCEN